MPLSTNDKNAFDNYRFPSDRFTSNASAFNLSLPSTSNQQKSTKHDLNNVINGFDRFNPLNNELSLNQEYNQFHSHVVPKYNVQTTRTVQIINVLPGAFHQVMNIIKEWSSKVAYIDQSHEPIVAKTITLVFFDLRDAIGFYTKMEAISGNPFNPFVLLKLVVVYCRDELAASIFGLQSALDFHKAEFYLTFLAPIAKLRESQYMNFLKSFGDLRLTQLIHSDANMTTIYIDYFDTRVTINTSQILENSHFKEFQMIVSFMPIFNNNDSKVMNFTPFDEEPSFFNDVSGSQLLPPLIDVGNGRETKTTNEYLQQPLSSFDYPSQPTLPFNRSRFSSLSSVDSIISTPPTSLNELKQIFSPPPSLPPPTLKSQEKKKLTSFNYYTNPMLRNPSNTLLLSKFIPDFENNHQMIHPPNNNIIHNKSYYSIQSKPIPSWPFMNNDETTLSNPTTKGYPITKINSNSSNSFSSIDSGHHYNMKSSLKVSQSQVNFKEFKMDQNKDLYKSIVFLDKVKDGSDKRSTFMIRNIPNKYTLDMLREFLDATNKATYDFLYLRFDFANDCNAGYAFVNFIDPKSVLPFINERVGKIWNKFNSEKLCDIAYAKIQGKKSLVVRFKNSNVMKQQVEYRPIIFYSSGPKKGLEEPFPISRDYKEDIKDSQ
ncbi:unnamed protein product [Cunninghamella blakesleeana]